MRLRDNFRLQKYTFMIFIFLLFIAWRSILFLAAVQAARFFPFIPSFPYSQELLISSRLPVWLWSFANFDGVHYVTIAISGYSAQFTQVFFPLYPLLIHFLHFIIPQLKIIGWGLIISNISFLFSLFVFRKMVLLDYKRQVAVWTMLFLSVFPTAFFFGSVYTESLFLLLTLLSFYFARKNQWLAAGICGGLASATRLIGIFILPALIWERYAPFNFKNFNGKNLISGLVTLIKFPPVYLISSGLVTYMIYLQIFFKDFLYFWHVQGVFGAQRNGSGMVLLPQVFWRYFKILSSVPMGTASFQVAFTEVAITFLTIVLLLLAHKMKIHTSYLIFSWLAVLVPTLTGTFSSMPRYVLVTFPIFIVLARINNPLFRGAVCIISFCFLILLTVLFTRGHWVS
jgi:hypothetical protein